MTRGGKRPGAGRKPKLTFLQKFSIGGEVESRWRLEWDKSTQQELKRKTVALRKEWKKVQEMPVAERKGWLKSYAYELHQEDIEFALEEDGLSRVHKVTPKRPKGPLKDIIQTVAQERGLSFEMVRKCHILFRKVEKELIS